jgi:hypothetical protein
VRFQYEWCSLEGGALEGVSQPSKKMHKYKYWNLPLGKKKTILWTKIKGWEPIYQNYKANENTSKHNNPKTKTKAKQLPKISSKDSMQRGFNHSEMIINPNTNKEDLR